MSRDCQARQYNDEMKCGRCGLSWDMNDPDPPQCGRTIDRRAIPTRRATVQAKRVEESLPPGIHVAPRLNGCHSKPRPVAGAVTHLAQDGYGSSFRYSGGELGRNPLHREIKHVMSTDCQYDKRATDPGCKGCPWAKGD